ncbi:hypothetical protein CK203_042030 [Vitis vinifera]|uniref:Uncharacterized protein n=1 Tax=Vitis vinifera TaxID=29760 RepID=A0A438HHD6_VITVI|nr:hypothetical protein CK203_042030 [Vitis vinifera]
MGEVGAARDGRSWFVVESKSFDILVEDVGGKLKGCIWERSKGISSWIQLGEVSLRCLLDGVEAYCREIDNRSWVLGWEEGGRKYSVERHSNEAGRFILCFVRDLKTKKNQHYLSRREGAFWWMEYSGREVERPWCSPFWRLKGNQSSRASIKGEGEFEGSLEGEGGGDKVYADAVKLKPGRIGDSVWLELGKREVQGRLGGHGLGLGGFKSGPTGLGLGEAQGHEKEPQVVLGREDDVLRLIALNALKGCLVGCEEEYVLGLGPEVVGVAGEGYSTRPESSVPNSRASEESSIGKAREERGDEDPLEGISRATLSLEALEVVKRATFTKEALFAEASRGVKGGSLGGLASVDGGEEQNPLNIILANGRTWEMAFEGEKSLAEEGVGVRMRRCFRIWRGKAFDGMTACLVRRLKFKMCPWVSAQSWSGKNFRFPSERSREGRISASMRRFSEVIDELALRDLPLQEGPLLGMEDGGRVRRGQIPFRFENMWMKEKRFKEMLKAWWQDLEQGCVWESGVNKRLALDRVSFWDDQERLRALSGLELEARRRIRRISRSGTYGGNFLRQKSRETWLKEGDKNIGFFHKMANSNRRRNCFGEGLDCCFQKAVAGEDDFGGSGRRVCLEDTGDLKGASGPVGESLVELQKDQRVTGLAVKDRAMTVPLEWFKSTSAWISAPMKLFRLKRQGIPLIPSLCVSRGAGLLFFIYFLSEKSDERVPKSQLWIGEEMVEADVGIRPLNMVLAGGSVAVASSEEERALVVVGFLEWAALDSRGMAGGGCYGPAVRRFREDFWEELGTIRGLWQDPCGAIQSLLPRIVSDHCPILLDYGRASKGSSPFRFENMWLKEEGFKDLLRNWWMGFQFRGSFSFTLSEKLKALKACLKIWNREVFGNVTARKESALKQMMSWDSIERDKKERDIKDGVVQAFHSLLSETDEWRPRCNGLQVGVLEGEATALLEAPFSEEEVFGALSDLNGDKAPGPDGFTMGDPLSPYLFMIVMEALSCLLKRAKEGRFLPGWQLSGRGGVLLELASYVVRSHVRVEGELDKSEIIAVGRVKNVEELALEFGCKVSQLPSSYLGLPFGARFKKNDLDPEHSIQHAYLLYVLVLDAKEYKRKGGLSVRNLALLNKALLCKWSWRFAVEKETLWRQVICAKYGEEEGGWRSRVVRGQFWGGLAFGRTSGEEMILCVLLFPSLFAISLDKEAWVAYVWSHSGGGVWAPRFSKRLNDWEVFDVEHLLLRLHGKRVYSDVKDQVIWTKAKDGRFSV